MKRRMAAHPGIRCYRARIIGFPPSIGARRTGGNLPGKTRKRQIAILGSKEAALRIARVVGGTVARCGRCGVASHRWIRQLPIETGVTPVIQGIGLCRISNDSGQACTHQERIPRILPIVCGGSPVGIARVAAAIARRRISGNGWDRDLAGQVSKVVVLLVGLEPCVGAVDERRHLGIGPGGFRCVADLRREILVRG